MYQDLLFLIYMKHNVFRATPPIIRSLPKTALAAPGFSYVEGCWMCGWWMLSGTDVPDNVQPPSTYEKPEAASAVLGF